jgi:drug/metabolite transporter (DMT)-like permease
MYTGEFIALSVAITWTITALCGEVASRRIGASALNVIRMCLSLCLLGVTMAVVTGRPYPLFTNGEAWLWLSLSGLVGYVFGDYCLFNCYNLIGSRFGQLFMTLAPPSAALAGWMILGETLTFKALIGMVITMVGIGMSVLHKGESHKLSFKLPLRGILLGIGAGVGQGVGLVLSKVGMNYYEASIPEEMTRVTLLLPFAATFMRAVAGAAGFIILLLLRKEGHLLLQGIRDKKGMHAAWWATVTGPFVGVAMSLMAVRYTEAGIASTLMALTPIFIIAPAHWIFGQKVTYKEVIGAIISVVGVSFFFLG